MKPPQHSIDAEPVYIPPDDPAWDHDRIERESKEHPDEDHPVLRYLVGLTRYDITAPSKYAGSEASASEYITGSPALRVKLRRLTVHQLAEVSESVRQALRDHVRSGDDVDDFLMPRTVLVLCAKYGMAGCDGADYSAYGGKVSDSTLEEIYDKHGGLAALARIGTAVWHLSQPLSDAEKKA